MKAAMEAVKKWVTVCAATKHFSLARENVAISCDESGHN